MLSIFCFGFKFRCYLFEKLSDGQLLGADRFTFAAADALACFSCVLGVDRIIEARIPVIPELLFVKTSEKIWDSDLLGASVDTVAALGTGNKILCGEDGANLFDGFALFFVEGLEIGHIGKVVAHHIHVSHTREHHKCILKACGKADGIACVATALKGIEDCLGIVGEVDEASALNRLHYDHGLTVLAAALEAELGLNRGILIVEIIELYLHNLDLRVFGKDLIEDVGGIVEGDAEMLDFAFVFKLKAGLICFAGFIFFEKRCEARAFAALFVLILIFILKTELLIFCILPLYGKNKSWQYHMKH